MSRSLKDVYLYTEKTLRITAGTRCPIEAWALFNLWLELDESVRYIYNQVSLKSEILSYFLCHYFLSFFFFLCMRSFVLLLSFFLRILAASFIFLYVFIFVLWTLIFQSEAQPSLLSFIYLKVQWKNSIFSSSMASTSVCCFCFPNAICLAFWNSCFLFLCFVFGCWACLGVMLFPFAFLSNHLWASLKKLPLQVPAMGQGVGGIAGALGLRFDSRPWQWVKDPAVATAAG